jgi:POT family proton-dependent oligopeptide transporter
MLPTVVFLFCPLVLWLGRNRYHRSKPEGSVLMQAIRVWRYCARGRWTWNPTKLWKNMRADGFFDTAKPSRIPLAQRPKWMTFDDKWVDQVRRGFKACEVFVWFPIYCVFSILSRRSYPSANCLRVCIGLPYNQITNNLVSQAATMSTHGVPNDVINNLDPLAILILIPVHDLLIYPFLNRIGVRVTPLRKITLGFLVGTMAMIWAAVVQHYVYKTSSCGNFAGGDGCISPLNVWIQTGSYVLIAMSEIYASITGLEYAFTKAPKNMKSLVMSIFLFTSAIASALGEAFVSAYYLHGL